MASITTTFQTFAAVARAGSLGASETWGTVANAQTSNNVRASYSNMTLGPQTGYTLWLQAKNLTDKVPDGKIIVGIVAHIERRKSAVDGTIQDDTVQSIKGGTVGGDDKSLPNTYTTSDVTLDYGDVDDLWGQTWTAEEVNASGFGIAYSAFIDLAFDPSWPEIDAMTVTIYFEDPPAADQRRGGKKKKGCGTPKALAA